MLSPRPLVLAAAALAHTATEAAAAAPCASYSTRFAQNIQGVCVCSTTAPCDEISSDYQSLASDQVGLFQTSLAGDRLAYSTLALDAANATTGDALLPEISLDSSVTFQQITGFGGAFTDSTALNVYKLPAALQEKLLDAYFSDNGLQYTLGRVPIGSTDFSESIYSYNPVEGDLDMVNFSIDIDKSSATHKLPLIKRALAKSSRPITLFASSWAPPAWMTRENKTQNSHVIGEPGGPYWKAMALYYSKFFDAYKKEGVEFWAMTTQNEPNYQIAPLAWQQLRFNHTQERDFIKKDLGPLMKQTHPQLKIIMMDDQKNLLPKWDGALVDPDARQYISGVGVHWYFNLDFISESLGNFKELSDFHAKNPDMFILATEACSGSMPDGIGTGVGVKLLQPAVIWRRGENYARDIINDLANFAVGWTDWNMVLDTKGGPTWVGNTVDAPILIDEVGRSEFYKQPMYYVMGHFAKFLPAGSTRVALSVSAVAPFAKVDKVAFVTPTGQLVVVLSNRNKAAISMKVNDTQGKRVVSVTLPANGIQTILFGARGAPTPTTPTPTTTIPTMTEPTPTTPEPTTTTPTTTEPTTPTTSEPTTTTTPVTTVPPTNTPTTTTPATPCPLPSPTDPTTRPSC